MPPEKDGCRRCDSYHSEDYAGIVFVRQIAQRVRDTQHVHTQTHHDFMNGVRANVLANLLPSYWGHLSYALDEYLDHDTGGNMEIVSFFRKLPIVTFAELLIDLWERWDSRA